MAYIFIHGLGQTEKSWDGVISRFTKSNAHCPNLQSLLKNEERTYENLYESFKAYCDGFCEPLHLCGLSLGGILALNYAIDFPHKVNTLVLIGTQYKMPKTLLKAQSIVFRFLPNSMFDHMGFTKNQFIRLTNSMAHLDFSDSLSCILCRCLILCGSKDYANKKAAAELLQQLKHARLLFIENAGHEVNREQCGRLAQEINRFYSETN